MKILSSIRISVDKQFGYGYLKEIVVRRANQKEYAFNKADFSRLHLNDIEDMLFIYVQNKIHHLKGDEQVDLINALRLFTQRIVLKKRAGSSGAVDKGHRLAKLRAPEYSNKIRILICKILRYLVQYSFFDAFIGTADVPEINMRQFWHTVTYNLEAKTYFFTLDDQSFEVNADLLHDALHITSKDYDHPFVTPPPHDEIVSFIKNLDTLDLLIKYQRW
ncbi:hypothetical protein Tco_0554316 [Tanacetum coccineum]